MPLISIVTVSLNAVDTIRETLESVAVQSFVDYEHIVIDGASTDGTRECLEEFGSNRLFWKSEPDLGLYDAMNKGVASSSGDFLIFLNADDQLCSTESLHWVSQVVGSKSILYAFPILLGNSTESKIRKPWPFGFRMRFKTCLWHQGTVISRKLFERIGPYNSSLKIAGDYDWFLRAYLSGVAVAYFDEPFALMGDQGISMSSDWETVKRRIMEEKAVHGALAEVGLWSLIYRLYWLGYPRYKRLLS